MKRCSLALYTSTTQITRQLKLAVAPCTHRLVPGRGRDGAAGAVVAGVALAAGRRQAVVEAVRAGRARRAVTLLSQVVARVVGARRARVRRADASAGRAVVTRRAVVGLCDRTHCNTAWRQLSITVTYT